MSARYWIGSACVGVLAALWLHAIVTDGKRGARMMLEGSARGLLMVVPVIVGDQIGGSIGSWVAIPICWAASWFGHTSLGMLNFLLLQWFGVRLAKARDLHPADWFATWRDPRWMVIRWVWPMTGWWSRYRYIARRS